jgi:hypothetical protein
VSGRVAYLRSAHRPPPALVVHVGLEERPHVHVVAGTDLDAQRLVGWLEHSDVVERLPELIADAIDRLRAGGENEAA